MRPSPPPTAAGWPVVHQRHRGRQSRSSPISTPEAFPSTVVEVMELNATTTWMTTMVREAAQGWDGNDPTLAEPGLMRSARQVTRLVERGGSLRYRQPSWLGSRESGSGWSDVAPSPSGISRRSRKGRQSHRRHGGRRRAWPSVPTRWRR